jgi:lipopolysaccharide/colanic/teichoic acid biosynthesis glycosyltransferase
MSVQQGAAKALPLLPRTGTPVSAVSAVQPATELSAKSALPAVATPPRSTVKRALDIATATLLLIMALPFMLLIALAITLTSRGPALLVQDRVGRDGELFRMLKFRTMVRGADEYRDEIIGTPDDGILDRYRTDPRITMIGRILRRWSIDELPQLVNVVGGSMSLVGPRPILPEERVLLGNDHHLRHAVKPGLTGLWQISGRKEVTWDDRMTLDMRYINDWSPSLDAMIVRKTFTVIIKGVGAL